MDSSILWKKTIIVLFRRESLHKHTHTVEKKKTGYSKDKRRKDNMFVSISAIHLSVTSRGLGSEIAGYGLEMSE